MKKEAKAAKAAKAEGKEHTPLAKRSDAAWLPALLEEFLQVLETAGKHATAGKTADAEEEGGDKENGSRRASFAAGRAVRRCRLNTSG